MRGCSHGPGKKKFPVSQAGALSPMLGGMGEDAGLVCTSPGQGGMEMKIDVHRSRHGEAQSWRRGWEWQTQSRRQKVGWGRVVREAVDRETHWATVHSGALHKRLPISEITDSCLKDTFPADSGKVSGGPHMGGFQYFPHRHSVLWRGRLFQIGTKALMNPWWPCAETKKERALSSLLHTLTHTPTLSQAELERWTTGQGEKGPVQGGLVGEGGVPRGRRRSKDVGRWLRDTGGSEVHRRGGRILRHSGGQGGIGERNDGTILFGGVDCQSHPLNFVWMSCGEQSICPWVPREIPGQGSRGVARPSRLAAPSASMHHPPGRPWCLPAPGPRQGSVHGLRQGATVQGSSCGPPAHSGTMERHVGVSWGEMGGLGTEDWEATPAGKEEGRGSGCSPEGLRCPKALGQRSASGVYRGP